VARAARPRIDGGWRASAAAVAGWFPGRPRRIPTFLIEKSKFRAGIFKFLKLGAFRR